MAKASKPWRVSGKKALLPSCTRAMSPPTATRIGRVAAYAGCSDSEPRDARDRGASHHPGARVGEGRPRPQRGDRLRALRDAAERPLMA